MEYLSYPRNLPCAPSQSILPAHKHTEITILLISITKAQLCLFMWMEFYGMHFFCVSLFSLNRMFLRFIHIILCVNSSSLFYFWVVIYHSLFIHSPVCEHLSYFHLEWPWLKLTGTFFLKSLYGPLFSFKEGR